jgi:hypothetical protein
MENSLLFWLTTASALCWPLCFWLMWQISCRQSALLKELREQGKRIEKLSQEEHDLIKEVHPVVEEIREGIAEVTESENR